MAVSFTHPWYLVLFPILGAGGIYLARRSLADLRGARARWSLGLRLLILACGVLALAGLQVRQPARRLAVLFVLDQSNSIPTDQKQRQLDYVHEASKRMGPEDMGGVLVFGSDAYLEIEVQPVLRLGRIHSMPGRDYTNLAGALRLAMAAFPEDAQRRIVLLSDGNENLGDAITEAAAAAGSGIQIDVVPISYRYSREAMLDKLVLPAEAKVGEPFEVRLIVRSTWQAPGVVRLLRNGELIAQQRVELRPGPNVVTFPQSLDRARFHTYEAIVEAPDDEVPDNNRGMGFVLVRGRPRVLIVANEQGDARYLEQALAGQQLDVDVRQPGRLPATLAEFQSYDSVVLNNVAAHQLTPDQMKSIRSSVRDLGTGLVMVGGPNSFGPGAYRGTPIEEALPVDMEVKKHKVMPVGAVSMILHTCEFPDGNRWAAETAAAVVDVLGERDKVGVLLYDIGERWGIPMQHAANKERIKAEIYNLNPGDAPDFQSLMSLAYDGLLRDASEAAVRHMIIISDGDPSPPTPELLARIARARITVSTVAVFPHGGGTGTLEEIARVGKGQFYNVRHPSEIPRIFLKEAQRVLKPAIIEEPFTPNTLPDSQLLAGIPRVPPLLGYVATSAKQAPGVEVALSSQRDDPILASWRYGLGRSVAFTSDARNRWAAPWLRSPGTFSRFWAQAVRWTVRTTSRAELDTQVEIQQRRGRVTVDVVDAQGRFVNDLDIRASVAGERVSPRLRVDQTAPGRYEGTFEAPDQGQYVIALRYTDARGTPRIHTVGAAVPYSPEYADLAANTAVLTRLADLTGGRVYPVLNQESMLEHLAAVWRHDRRVHSAPRELWPLLLLAAALLLPADIAVRRLAVSRADWQEVTAVLLARLRFPTNRRRTPSEREEGLGRLALAKARAARRMHGAAVDGGDHPEAGEPVPEREATGSAAEPLEPRQGDTPSEPAAGESRSLLDRLRSRAPRETGGAQATAAHRPGAPAGKEGDVPAGLPPQDAAPAVPPAPGAPASPTSPGRPEGGGVVWHRPVPGVAPQDPGSRTDAEGTGPPRETGEPPAADEGDSTSRLLRARRRARGERDD